MTQQKNLQGPLIKSNQKHSFAPWTNILDKIDPTRVGDFLLIQIKHNQLLLIRAQANQTLRIAGR